MLAEERRNRILQLLTQKKSISVKDLSIEFQTTEATIRKDLDDLQIQNKLRRVHGGAVEVGKVSESLLDTDLEIRCPNEKKAIAKCAYNYIYDGDTILLDSSTTVKELTKLISTGERKNLTIFTYSLNNISILKDMHKYQIIFIGGLINSMRNISLGAFAEDFINKIRVDKCFMGANGIEKIFGFSVPTIEEASLKRKMASVSRQTYILADSTKFNKQYLMTFLDLNDPISAIITDDKISPLDIQLYGSLIKLIIVPMNSTELA
jgi:DeoR family fructose operon transcriptional repressor